MLKKQRFFDRELNQLLLTVKIKNYLESRKENKTVHVKIIKTTNFTMKQLQSK